VHLAVMSEAKLTALVTTPDNEITRALLQLDNASILHSKQLLAARRLLWGAWDLASTLEL